LDRSCQDPNDLVGQPDALLYRALVQPASHPLVAAPGFAGGAPRNIEEPNVLGPAQSSMPLLDVGAHRIGAANLLANQSVATGIVPKALHVP
jgi:hypothetical protein